MQSSESERGSDSTLENNHADAEKQNNIKDTQSANSDHNHNSDVEKADEKAYPEASAPLKNPMMDPSSFPDGGREAWSTVAGAFCALFVSFGQPT